MRIRTCLLIAAAILALGRPAWSQEEREPRRGAPERGPETRPAMRGELGQMTEVCGLSEDQQKKLAEIQQARQKEMMELQAKYQALIMDVLTPEQRAKWNEAQFVTMAQRSVGRTTLSDEQVNKIKAYVAEQVKTADLSNERGRGELMRKIMEYVRTEVLTDEQREALRSERRPPERREPERKEDPAPR